MRTSQFCSKRFCAVDVFSEDLGGPDLLMLKSLRRRDTSVHEHVGE